MSRTPLTTPTALRRIAVLGLLATAAPASAIGSSSVSTITGDGPTAVAARGTGADVFIANRPANTIAVLDARSQQVVRTITRQAGGRNADLAADPVRDRIYDLDEALDRLVVRRGSDGRILRTIPLPPNEVPIAVAVEPTDRRVFVLSRRAGGSVVHRISTLTAPRSRVDPIQGSRGLGPGARDLAVSDVDDRVYVSMGTEDRLRVIRTSNLSQAASIVVGDDPRGVAVLSPGTSTARVLVANRGSDTVSAMSPAGGSVSQTIDVGDAPVAIAVDDVALRAWVVNNRSGDVTVIERRDGSMVPAETRAGGASPTGVAVDPLTHRAVVSRPPEDRVRVIRRYHPRAHGFEFVNNFAVPIQVDLPGLPAVDLGQFRFGLCGGMSYSSLDTFLAGASRPATGTATPTSGPVFGELVERITDSLSGGVPPMLSRYATLQALPDDDVPGPFGTTALKGLRTTTIEEAAAIVPTLDTGRPVPLGVIFASGLQSPLGNHQVLAIGHFTVNGERVIEVYDPNFPAANGDDDGITYMWTAQRRQTSDRAGFADLTTFRGLFSAEPAYQQKTPPWA
ncbi:MAG: hypothetical protein MUE51_06450 [Thermoleophilia bacterium]|nr:hypothetical protein [Thermoleophilia bacterium]